MATVISAFFRVLITRSLNPSWQPYTYVPGSQVMQEPLPIPNFLPQQYLTSPQPAIQPAIQPESQQYPRARPKRISKPTEKCLANQRTSKTTVHCGEGQSKVTLAEACCASVTMPSPKRSAIRTAYTKPSHTKSSQLKSSRVKTSHRSNHYAPYEWCHGEGVVRPRDLIVHP
jgi:hypothetical protein